MRRCKDCALFGPAEWFAKGDTSLYGHRNLCRNCFRKRYREYARRRREKVGVLALNITPSARFARLKQKARQRGIPLELTREQWESVVAQPCHYCDGPLAPTGYGLDRKDTRGPYTLANVVPCCQQCNRRKECQTYDVAYRKIRGA